MSYRIMVTGHRDLPQAKYDEIWCETSNFFAAKLRDHEDLTVLIGMAKGADSLAGLVCVTLGIPFTACVPHRDYAQHYNLDMNVYQYLIRQCSKLVYVNDLPKFDWRMNFERNRYMVRWCDEALAITHLNKDASNPDVSLGKSIKGGTADAILELLRAKKPISYIHF